MAEASALVLDVAQLSSATNEHRGEVWLLTWLSNSEKALKTLPDDAIRTHAKALQDSLVKLAVQTPTASAPAPKPARPVRALISRCLDLLFARTESRTLFDCMQALSKSVADPKLDKDNKTAALHCAGHVMLVHGQQITSQVADLVSGALKCLKQTTAPVGVRFAALVCIRNTLKSGGKAVNDALAKDVSKHLRNTLSDKIAPLQSAAADAILAFYESGLAPLTGQEIDSILVICLKQFETSNFETRTTFARLLAALLSTTQIEGSGALARPPMKKRTDSSKKPDESKDEEDPYPSAMQEKEASKTMMSLHDMLSLLSKAYLRPQTTRRVRVGLVAVYSALLSTLGSIFIEAHYLELARHIIENIGRAAPRSATNSPQAALHQRYEDLTNRRCASILLRQVIGVRLLSEQGQVAAIRDLSTAYLSNWPSLLPGHPPPSKASLLVSLQETAGLVLQLGCAPQSVQDALDEPLLRLVEHPSYSVQIAAAWCLRSYASVAPTRLASITSSLLDSLTKDLAQLESPDSATFSEATTRVKGHVHALASLISVVPHRPLYNSYDTSARIMSLAIQLLKQSANHDLRVSSVEIQVAWQLVSSLMTLGPNFVRLHLPQLLILWKNSLPKPASKEASASQGKSEAEWSFLLLIREWTLASILSFLRHNRKLVSSDVTRRIAQLFSNAFTFLTSLSTQHKLRLHDQTTATGSSLQLVDRELFFRRRLYQCFAELRDVPGFEAHVEGLLLSAVTTFADPEVYTGSAVQAAIAASSGTFTSVWEVTDGFSFGVTSLLDDSGVHFPGEETRHARLNRDEVDVAIDTLISQPVMGALEHDVLTCSSVNLEVEEAARVPPPATGVVNAAIDTFKLLLPTQSLQTHVKVLNQLVGFIQSPKTERNPGRRMAILVNAVVSVVGTLRVSMQGSSRHAGETISVPQISKQLREIAKDSMLHSDSRLRQAGSEALGRLCFLAGTSFMTSQVQFCVTQVVSNTDPHGRAGCALALGQIYTHVGSLSAGPVLKTIFDVLISLSSDPHPLVHFWALQSLSEVVSAASLSYAPYTNATLSAITRLFLSDTHDPEGGSPASVNLRSDLPAYQAFCYVLDAIIGVLGPDLQVDERVQSLVLILLKEFRNQPDEGIQVEAIKATHHFLIFAPDAVDLGALLADFRKHLASPRQTLKNAAINSVYQLVQRNAALMSRLGGDRFAEELFTLLDENPSVVGVRAALSSWLKQTVVINPGGWIDLCQRIVSKTTASAHAASSTGQGQGNPGGITFTDEESQGIGLGASDTQTSSKTTSRWRTQFFALQCTHLVFVTLHEQSCHEHFDASLSRTSKRPQRTLLIHRVSDLIKMAFTASTAPVMEIRLEGLVLLRDVIKSFSRTTDVDFDGAPLLEQYQAPIAAALTPAFSADSFPEVLSSAIQLCATFISSGVVKEIPKMGRILKLLTTSLESCKERDISAIGDFSNLTSTAAVMLKTSIFSAWAELQCASAAQPYLAPLVKPYMGVLCRAWLATLREYARLRCDVDSVAGNPSPSSSHGIFDSSFSGLSREAALPYFELAWRPMLGACGSLLRVSDPNMLEALDGPQEGTDNNQSRYFQVLFGLAFDILASPSKPEQATSQKAAATTASVAVDVLDSLIELELCDQAVVASSLFDDLTALCFRLSATESVVVQIRVVRLVAKIAKKQTCSTAQANGLGPERSEREDSRMTQCVSIAVSILQRHIKRSARETNPVALQPVAALLEAAWATLADIADCQSADQRDNLYAVAISLYSQLLESSATSTQFVNATLPVLKALAERAYATASSFLHQVLEAFLSAGLRLVDEALTDKVNITRSKHNMLSAVLLVTVFPSEVQISQATLEHLCNLLLSFPLQKESELQLTALQCIRTLFTAASRGGPAQMFCVSLLAPSLAVMMLGEDGRKALDGPPLMECFRILGTLPSAIPQPKVGMDISVPVLVQYLSEAEYKDQATADLLAIATVNPAAFKNTTRELNSEQQTQLEDAIRQPAGNNHQQHLKTAAGGIAATTASAIPSINLKSFAS